MPTGYTANVANGTLTTFPEFAMQCARAFGALIMMRDDPIDSPIPDEFTVAEYYEKNLNEAKAALAELQALNERDVLIRCAKEYAEAMASWEKSRADNAAKRQRYESMLAKVRQWIPPTSEHEGLKEFMIQQLTESLEWDCGGEGLPKPTITTPSVWRAEQLLQYEQDVERLARGLAEEAERVRKRNQWVRDLRESLKQKT